MRDLLLPIYRTNLNYLQSYLINRVIDAGTEPSVHAENAVINDRSQRHVVENISAVSPHIQRSVFPQAFIVEAIDLSDLSAFVVSSDEGNEIGVPDFEGQEQQECLDAVEAPIYEISEEEVADVGDISSVFEEFEEIVELPVDVSADGDGGVYSLDVAFFDEYFFGFGAEVLDFLFCDHFSAPELLNLFVNLAHYIIITAISARAFKCQIPNSHQSLPPIAAQLLLSISTKPDLVIACTVFEYYIKMAIFGYKSHRSNRIHRHAIRGVHSAMRSHLPNIPRHPTHRSSLQNIPNLVLLQTSHLPIAAASPAVGLQEYLAAAGAYQPPRNGVLR